VIKGKVCSQLQSLLSDFGTAMEHHEPAIMYEYDGSKAVVYNNCAVDGGTIMTRYREVK
jgi:hypothetical protein